MAGRVAVKGVGDELAFNAADDADLRGGVVFCGDLEGFRMKW